MEMLELESIQQNTGWTFESMQKRIKNKPVIKTNQPIIDDYKPSHTTIKLNNKLIKELNNRFAKKIQFTRNPFQRYRTLCDLDAYTSLRELWCDNIHLAHLPEILPATLTVLSCSNNILAKLPVLTKSLKFLNCSHNLLQTLPDLPDSLNVLQCGGNISLTLPAILPVALKELSCQLCRVKSLPPLPPTITVLRCAQCELVCLPSDLPDMLRRLECHGNKLTYLPLLPESLTYLKIKNNLFELEIYSKSLGEIRQWLRENPPYFEPMLK